MEREQATIVYGIQTQTEKGAKWAHCHENGEPLFFESAELASDAIDRLWSATRSARSDGETEGGAQSRREPE